MWGRSMWGLMWGFWIRRLFSMWSDLIFLVWSCQGLAGDETRCTDFQLRHSSKRRSAFKDGGGILSIMPNSSVILQKHVLR